MLRNERTEISTEWKRRSSVPGGKVNILRGHTIGHSKQKSVFVHVSYSELFPRQSFSLCSLDLAPNIVLPLTPPLYGATI
jgi:hypothetical protein